MDITVHENYLKEIDNFKNVFSNGYSNDQKKISKLLVNAGEKDRSLFFNRMHQKINRLRQRIILDNETFDFEC